MRKKITLLLAMDGSVTRDEADFVKNQMATLLPETDILVISKCNGITVWPVSESTHNCCECVEPLRAERDDLWQFHQGDIRAWGDLVRRAEQAEAERDDLLELLRDVEAIEAGNVCPHGFEPDEPGCGCYMCRVRAALRGDQ